MTAPTVFSTDLAHELQDILDDIADDDTDGVAESTKFRQWMNEKTMDKAFATYVEMGGPGLAEEIEDGEEIPTKGINQGWTVNFIARKFGLKIHVTEDALEDNKHEEIIQAAKRLKRALWKTADIDATNIWNRIDTAGYVGGDGVTFASASHTLPGGGTFSNQMATAKAPSVASYIVAQAAVTEYPGHDGVTGDNYSLSGVVYPHGQRGQWETLLGSDKDPEMGNFSAINVAASSRSGLKQHALVHWTASDTNYAYLVDMPNNDQGLCWFWRRKPRNRSWVDNDQEIMKYSISARWTRGWIDPRCIHAVLA